MTMAMIDRIADKFTVGDDCWEWTAARDQDGYGFLTVQTGHGATRKRTTRRAHRVLYEMLVGPIPDGLVIDHLCRNPGCVRPLHLEPVTNAENLRRGEHAGRRKTHCPQGHPYSGENLYVWRDGGRRCRRCQRASALSRYYRLKRERAESLADSIGGPL